MCALVLCARVRGQPHSCFSGVSLLWNSPKMLPDQQAPGILLPLLPQCWDCKSIAPPCLACSLFQCGFWGLNSGPCDCKAYTGPAWPSPKLFEVSFLGYLEPNPVQLLLLPVKGHTQNILLRIYVPGLRHSQKPMSSSHIVGKEED